MIGILSTQRIPGGDLVENGCFLGEKLANVCGFSDFDRGAMRQKIAILKEGNSVDDFIGGHCDRKSRFKKRKQRLEGYKFFWRNFHEFKILYEDNVMISSKYIFWDSWAKLVPSPVIITLVH